MERTNITISIPVRSVDAALRWYERCLELEGHIDPAPGICEYELRPGCWLQLSEGETARSEHCLLLGVADLEGERARLMGMGVEVGEIQRVEGAVAFVGLRDPMAITSATTRSRRADPRSEPSPGISPPMPGSCISSSQPNRGG